jgi:hypothetical protein
MLKASVGAVVIEFKMELIVIVSFSLLKSVFVLIKLKVISRLLITHVEVELIYEGLFRADIVLTQLPFGNDTWFGSIIVIRLLETKLLTKLKVKVYAAVFETV